MRRLLTVMLALGLGLVACGDSGTDTATEANDIPGPTAKPAEGMSPNLDHSGHQTSSCSPSGTTLTIVAQSGKFNTDCLAAPANQQFTLSFENKDTTAHNIVLLESHSATEVMFRADLFAGPKTSTFTAGPFKAGNYAFHSDSNPGQMSGTFIVK